MSLRAIKKEAWDLPNIEENLQKFNSAWITQKKSQHLQDLSPEVRKNVNSKILDIQKTIHKAKNGQRLNEKLQSYARYLIELKLTTFQGNARKYQSITNSLLYDEFWNFKKTIDDIKLFSKNVRSLSHQYNELNNILLKELCLERSLLLMDQPHKLYIKGLNKTARAQRKIVKNMGVEFIELVKNGS
jgi:hypothetical protein